MRSAGRTTGRGGAGRGIMRRMKRVPGIIRAQISLRKMEKEDGHGMFLGNFIISGRQKASGARRVPSSDFQPRLDWDY